MPLCFALGNPPPDIEHAAIVDLDVAPTPLDTDDESKLGGRLLLIERSGIKFQLS